MQDTHPVIISLNGAVKRYTADFQNLVEYESGWQSVLKSAYGRAELSCGCRGVGSKRLAVKYYDGSGQFSLARFAMTGHQHAPDCHYFSANTCDGGPGAYTKGVIAQLDNGAVKIRLQIGMTERQGEASPPRPAADPGERTARPQQSSMKLLGLLHYLWEEAGLNQWKPVFAGKRKAPLAYWLINTAADDVWAGKVRVVDQLLLPAYSPDSRDAARNLGRVESSFKAKRRMLLIAPLASYTTERLEEMEKRLKIAGFHGVPATYMQQGLWVATVRRFSAALAGWRAGHPTIVIAQLELRQGKNLYASAIDLALMSVTPQFIPVESSYERIVADKLVEQGRSFIKPLRYDASADKVHPDFILMDAAKQIPLEVFGRDDPDYVKRKREKTAYYDAQYGRDGWWSWDAGEGGSEAELPPFPLR